MAHMEFVCNLYEEQHRQGRYFLHKHPMNASSWELGCIRRLAAKMGIYIVRADMCRFGLKSKDQLGEGLAIKPTYFMTNSLAIAKRLAQPCAGDHRHVHLMEGRAAKAAEYTPELCREICKGLIEQKRADANNVVALSSMTWADCDVTTMKSTPQVHEMSLNQLIGRSTQTLSASSAGTAPELGAYSGNHEDQGVPNTLAGGESEMDKWLREHGEEVAAWDDVSGK